MQKRCAEPRDISEILNDVITDLKARADANETTGGKDDMNEQAKEARRAYKREWNRRNPDKVKAAQARYWTRKAEAAAAAAKADETESDGEQLA